MKIFKERVVTHHVFHLDESHIGTGKSNWNHRIVGILDQKYGLHRKEFIAADNSK